MACWNRDMTEAPQDGTPVVLRVPDVRTGAEVGCFTEFPDGRGPLWRVGVRVVEPTGWAPLPVDCASGRGLRAVQFHPRYCAEAKGTPPGDCDSSHDLSVLDEYGYRIRVGCFKHAGWAAHVGKLIERHGLPGLAPGAATLAPAKEGPR